MNRTERIAALRQFADLLEQCPDLPCPDDAFISLRDGDDDTAVNQLHAAEEQLAACGITVRREPSLIRGRQHLIAFDIGDFTYETFRVFTDSRVAAKEVA